jgi:hypothetical protein
MTKHDLFPSSPDISPHNPEEATFQSPEEVQYADPSNPHSGELAIVFKTPGDALVLGEGSSFKYAQDFGPSGIDFAIVRTKQGNSYGLGAGVVLNHREGTNSQLPTSISMKVGEFWPLSNDEVEAVILREGGKHAALGEGGARQIGQPSPFPALLKELEAARQELYPEENLAPLH